MAKPKTFAPELRSFRLEKEMRAPVVAWAERQGLTVNLEAYHSKTIADITAVELLTDRCLERLRGEKVALRGPLALLEPLPSWYPYFGRVVAIELKLRDWPRALYQAASYRRFARETFVALPDEIATWALECASQKFHRLGVGLLAVKPGAVSIVVTVHGFFEGLVLLPCACG